MLIEKNRYAQNESIGARVPILHLDQSPNPSCDPNTESDIVAALTALISELQERIDSRSGSALQFHSVELAKKLYANRSKVDQIFEFEGLAASPAWDMLLDLWIARTKGVQVSVSSACIGSRSPSTTGLRWLGVLEKKGLASRQADPSDSRRAFVSLSDHGAAKVAAALACF